MDAEVRSMASADLEWSAVRPRVTKRLLGQIASRIAERFHPEKIILFGSYANGRPTLDSDVDLLVVMQSEEPLFPRIRRVAEVAQVPYLPMDVIVRTPVEVAERLAMGDSFLAGILEKGTVLYDRGQ